MIEKWTFKRADQINLVSKGFKSYFESKYPNKTLVFYSNGIGNEFLGVELGKNEPVTDRLLQVVYAGNIGEGQGLHVILPELAKRMQDKVHFKIFGDGGRKAQLLENLKDYECTNVELLPPVNRSHLIDEYKNADVLFLHLNHYDAFKKVLPSKIFEYAAMGKPIWAGISGYSVEFVNAEIRNAAVFTPCDSQEAEQVFQNLIFTTALRQDFIDKYAGQRIMSNLAQDILSFQKV